MNQLDTLNARSSVRWIAVIVVAVLLVLYFVGFDTLATWIGYIVVAAGAVLAAAFIIANVNRKG